MFAVILGALLLVGCGSDDDGGAVSDSTSETTSDAGAGDGAVAIASFTFKPKTVTVPAGTTVTWTNEDSANHTVTANKDSAVEFDSGDLGEGDTFEQTFDEAGTYAYFCNIHQYMTGEVVVEG